jgi:hypothetical protein
MRAQLSVDAESVALRDEQERWPKLLTLLLLVHRGAARFGPWLCASLVE